MSRFVALPVPLLLIGPAKRLMDLKACSFSGEHAAFFQAFADRVSKPMILLPGKRHGQAAIQIASLIGQAQEVRRRLFQVIRLSFPDPIHSLQSFQALTDIAGGHLRDYSTIVFGNLPMNLLDLATTKCTVRFKDAQKVAGLD